MAPLPTTGLNYGTATNVTDVTWTGWVENASTTGSTVSVWITWASNATTAYVSPPVLSDEQRQRQQRELEERRARQAEARERAKVLLAAHLTRAQRKEYEEHGYFHVVTRNGRRRYRLRPGSAPVRVHGEDGRRWSYCIHPRESQYPAEDTALAQKLLLETDEERFLQIANASLVSA